MVTNPLLLDFPDHFETERLLIRAPRAGDGPAICEAVLETLDDLRQWMPWALQEQTVDRFGGIRAPGSRQLSGKNGIPDAPLAEGRDNPCRLKWPDSS